MIKITSKILKEIGSPSVDSYKGENGRLLIIAGSAKYHGAAVLASSIASKIIDFVYIHTTKANFEIIKKIRPKLAEFIYIDDNDLQHTITESDAILIGPGSLPDKQTALLVNQILEKNRDKKIIIDAGALRVVDSKLLHSNCIITPHKQEFESMFHCKALVSNAQKMSKKFGCIIILKGKTDYVVNGDSVFLNNTGNVGMTKGGTGDVLAGLIAGILTKNDPLSSAKVGIFVNGKAGDLLYKKVGRYYSASELIPQIQLILGKNI